MAAVVVRVVGYLLRLRCPGLRASGLRGAGTRVVRQTPRGATLRRPD